MLIVLHSIEKQKRDSVSDLLLLAKSLSSLTYTSMCYDPNLVPMDSDIKEEDKKVYKEVDEN